jgi:hypothetical protein
MWEKVKKSHKNKGREQNAGIAATQNVKCTTY